MNRRNQTRILYCVEIRRKLAIEALAVRRRRGCDNYLQFTTTGAWL